MGRAGTLTSESRVDEVISAEDGRFRAGTWRAQFDLGRVIVSVLPFECIGRCAIVELALTRAARSRGVLVLGASPGGQSRPTQVARSTSLPSGSASVHHIGANRSLTNRPPAARAAATRASA